MARTVAERTDIIPVLAEIFREHGFEGASLSIIGEKTGLGKGSLYHFFPGGKEEMAAAVLHEIDTWFENNVYRPLREAQNPRAAISGMCGAVIDYFHSGRRICLVGAFALDNVRDRFTDQIKDYFSDWKTALAAALQRAGHDEAKASELAEEAVISIQGGLILSRALGEPTLFERAMKKAEERLLT
ncbi:MULTISPECIES: TetR/AcrR family transcriptional regulator [Phyllobacterium]|jgi:TetR/AcrR family transcriptional regulator, lmrAB and yxaGH operons repressor|uniref:TetR family transcriptional regulator n=1 Tax=Phyllobacterium sophorae TaxID=1520277 RepID=A0A2P7BD77_9HYPH|nr:MULTISPECIES: TetR/AcrR family transcriptional regulator [Phyllobacterium]PSH64420.1 TetR family transcriptional regulator [Phyllobacterium sophorae]UXN64718.1 TetR/AcrR family transcriptional regulator [Phyllobacterium sp. A18/5-2]